jgi:hypothetical protein
VKGGVIKLSGCGEVAAGDVELQGDNRNIADGDVDVDLCA